MLAVNGSFLSSRREEWPLAKDAYMNLSKRMLALVAAEKTSENSESPRLARSSTASFLHTTQAPFPGKSAAKRGCSMEEGVRIVEGLAIRGDFVRGGESELEGSRASLSLIMNAETKKEEESRISLSRAVM